MNASSANKLVHQRDMYIQIIVAWSQGCFVVASGLKLEAVATQFRSFVIVCEVTTVWFSDPRAVWQGTTHNLIILVGSPDPNCLWSLNPFQPFIVVNIAMLVLFAVRRLTNQLTCRYLASVTPKMVLPIIITRPCMVMMKLYMCITH